MRLNVHFEDGEKLTVMVPDWAHYVRYNYVNRTITVYEYDPSLKKTVLDEPPPRRTAYVKKVYAGGNEEKFTSAIIYNNVVHLYNRTLVLNKELPRHQCKKSWWRVWETHPIQVHD